MERRIFPGSPPSEAGVITHNRPPEPCINVARLELLAHRLNAIVRVQVGAGGASLTRGFYGPAIVEVCTTAPRGAALPAAACMLSVLVLGWTGRRFELTFDAPTDDAERRRRLAQERASYRRPYRHGLRYLMPDAMLERWEAEQVDDVTAAWEAGVLPAAVAARRLDWRLRAAVR